MRLKNFFLICAVIGFLIPWSFFAPFVAENGLSPSTILSAFFVNGGAAAMSSDLILSILVFVAWVLVEQGRAPVPNGLAMVPLALLVGLSCALPLYLYFRLRAQSSVVES